MKKIIYYISVILIFVYSCSNNNNLSENPEYKDTALISKITIKKGNSNEIEIQKNNKGWLVNRKYKALHKSVDNFMLTISQVKIQNYIEQKKADSLIELFKKNRKTVKIFDKNDKLLKKWLIGNYNKKLKGTYISCGDFEKLYIANIPGVLNDLNRTIENREINWLSNYILNYTVGELNEVAIIYPDSSLLSFKLKVSSQIAELYSLPDNKKIENINFESVGIYLHYFEKIQFDSIATAEEIKLSKKNISNKPFQIIKVKNKRGIEVIFETYYLYNENFSNNIDIHRLLIYNTTKNIWYITRYVNIDLILKNIEYFFN